MRRNLTCLNCGDGSRGFVTEQQLRAISKQIDDYEKLYGILPTCNGKCWNGEYDTVGICIGNRCIGEEGNIASKNESITSYPEKPIAEMEEGAITIKLEIARMELDSMENVSRVIKPYNINHTLNKVSKTYINSTGKYMNHQMESQLLNILEMSQGFIGAHYHTLWDWAHDNGWDEVMGIGCHSECSKWALGSCQGACAGIMCDTVEGVYGHEGDEIIPPSKTYGMKVRLAF